MSKIQNLIDLVKSPRNKGIEADGLRKPATSFIKEFKLTAHLTNKVSCDLIYWVYVIWCKANIKKRIKRQRFFDGWSNLFTPYEEFIKGKHIRGYLLAPIKQFEVSETERQSIAWLKLEDQRRARIQSQKKKKIKQQKLEKKQKELEQLLKDLRSDSIQN